MTNNDLISRAAAIAEIDEYIEEYSELEPETGYHNLKWCAMFEAKEVLTMLPAVDAVPVVRCKDCHYWHQELDEVHHWYCTYGWAHQTTPDHYCADGKRRDGE